MLTPNQIHEISKKIAGTFNIPFVPERIEVRIVSEVVEKIADELDAILPKSASDIAHNAVEAALLMTDKSAFIDRATEFLNTKINVPFLSENQEGMIIRTVLNVIADAMFSAQTINTILNK